MKNPKPAPKRTRSDEAGPQRRPVEQAVAERLEEIRSDDEDGQPRRRQILEESFNATLGALFRRKREEKGLTVRQLAEYIEETRPGTSLSRHAIERLETNQSRYMFEHVLLFTKALDVDVTEIPGLREILSKNVRWKETLDQIDRLHEPGPHILEYVTGTEQFNERINLHGSVEELMAQPRLYLTIGGDHLADVGYPSRSILDFAKGRRPAREGELVLALHKPSGTVFLRLFEKGQLASVIPKQFPVGMDSNVEILGSHVGTYLPR